MTAMILLAAMALAFANGANDNFKGVATLYGSRQLSFWRALLWATLWTGAGAAVSLVVAGDLLALFQGKGFLPPELAYAPRVAIAALGGAAATVLLATKIGIPVSTTHALAGGMLGVTVAAGANADLTAAALKLGAPLLLSPLIAMLAALALYPLASRLRQGLGITKESCLCAVEGALPETIPNTDGSVTMNSSAVANTLATGTTSECIERYGGEVLRLEADKVQRFLHLLSGGAVSFSRALNDTPKLAALLLAGTAFSDTNALLAVAIPMLLGGLLWSRRVAETMSNQITEIAPGQGLIGNLVTAFLVAFASKMGVPVSTTHVSVGAIFGIGVHNGKADLRLISGILLAWITTLPIAAALAWMLFQV